MARGGNRNRNKLLVISILIGILATLVTGTLALLTGTTQSQANKVALSALYSPTGVSAAIAGPSVTLTWAAAQPNNNGNGNGYGISALNNGASAVCPNTIASYTYLGSTAALTFTDSSSAFLGGAGGTYVCYAVQTGYKQGAPPPWAAPPGWTSLDVLATAAIKLVQIAKVQAGLQTTGGSSVTITVPANSRAGDLFVATLYAAGCTTFTGPAGWARAATANEPLSAGLTDIWYRMNVPAGINSALFTCAGGAVTVGQLSEWSGVSTTTALDASGSIIDSTGGSATITAATTAPSVQQNELAVAAFQNNGSGTGVFTSQAGWTNLMSDAPNGLRSDYRLMVPLGPVSEKMTFNGASRWSAVIATFQR